MKKITFVLMVILACVAHWQWVSNISILTSGDWYYQDPLLLKEFFDIPSIWTPTSFGSINLGISFTPFQLVYGALSKMGVEYGLSQRIIFLFPIILAFPLCSYIYIRKNIDSNVAAFIGSVVYSYNTYYLILKTGHLTLLVAFAFFPLALYFLQLTLERKKLLYAIFTGLVGFIVSYYEFRAFYILAAIWGLYGLFYIFIVEKYKGIKNLLIMGLLTGIPFIIVFLLNVYWLVAFVKTGSLVSNTAFDRSLFGNEFLNILHAFTLHHPFWTGTKSAIFVVQKIPFYYWIIPITAIVGLYVKRKNENVLFIGILTLIGIFLTKQVAQPFSSVYPWLFDNFPGFNAFREASKFYSLIAIGYALLIAGFVEWVLKIPSTSKIKIFSKYIGIGIIAGLFLINLKPLITGEYATLFTPRNIPDDYKIVKEFILKQPNYFRTYWAPTYSRWSYFDMNHQQISAVNQINESWLPFIQKERDTNDYSEGELIIRMLRSSTADALFDESSIKYVFVPLKDDANEDDFFQYYGQSREYYIRELDRITFLKRIDIGTRNIVVYENTGYRPHIYVKSTDESIKENGVLQVSSKRLHPFEYIVTIKNLTSPINLYFSEGYHPQWKLRVGEFNWLSVLAERNYSIPESFHTSSLSGLNVYRVDPKVICAVFECKKNDDGSYDLEIRLYFSTQSYVYIGSAVSIVTLGVIFIILGYTMYEKNKQK